ncbi:hypothetical protein PICMEDRAFT_85371 [Pichia membranifaciens NRRL Y-2026]|uniref:Uncharacterized protein n=1 Tax=Pichia membranifaciens NRRL Y-2026 TaxID=763406 RepID=A0A1E3NRG2_9ASCO|nr:hypothetical protein PICMEDRAFT_85371 [Pichia membranifaciens NRRL Y-2026]ODQ48661.1 hypothetical protein PICMEDRAFT_85371 [Pichia membranifaciens NRRL Y-2026]
MANDKSSKLRHPAYNRRVLLALPVKLVPFSGFTKPSFPSMSNNLFLGSESSLVMSVPWASSSACSLEMVWVIKFLFGVSSEYSRPGLFFLPRTSAPCSLEMVSIMRFRGVSSASTPNCSWLFSVYNIRFLLELSLWNLAFILSKKPIVRLGIYLSFSVLSFSVTAKEISLDKEEE